MILEFTIKNFRSIKDKTTFSLIAENSNSIQENIYSADLRDGSRIELLKSAVIYGANGSGKSNILRAFYYLLTFVNDSKLSTPFVTKAGDAIWQYEPYLFNVDTRESPIEFSFKFIGPENSIYEYCIAFDSNEIISEELFRHYNNKIIVLFRRDNASTDKLIHYGYLGEQFDSRKIQVFHNKLLLSKFGEDEPLGLLTSIYVHMNKYNAINTHNINHIENYKDKIDNIFKNNDHFKEQLNTLIRYSDLKINSVELVDTEAVKSSKRKKESELYGIHDLYGHDGKVGEEKLVFHNESTGTNTLYVLGGSIIDTIMKGGVLFIDELETSLHPALTKFLVKLFHSEKLNKKGAQLVFATHDITLLSKSFLRRDQVWFTEKNKKGETELFSLQDFDEVNNETPFESWYIAGRFGAMPSIHDFENKLNIFPEGNE